MDFKITKVMIRLHREDQITILDPGSFMTTNGANISTTTSYYYSYVQTTSRYGLICDPVTGDCHSG